MDGSTLIAKWCIDSETGQEWLMDLKTGNKIIGRHQIQCNHEKRWFDRTISYHSEGSIEGMAYYCASCGMKLD